MLLRVLRSAVSTHGLSGRRVLVAVSGGVDSTVLLHALHEVGGIPLVVGHVNHGLRGEASDADEAHVRRMATRLGLPCRVSAVDPEGLRLGLPSRTRPTLQEAARRARYDALGDQAAEAGAACIATAHHADDQAETVLLRLLRGSGPDGLGGIPEWSPDGGCVRPLLGATREEIVRYAETRGLAWREDPSNRDPDFARARLRERWLPGLVEEFNPQLLRAIADLAEAHRRDAEWIEAMVASEAERRFTWEADGLSILREGWSTLPEALIRRLARHALRRCGAARDVSRTHLLRVVEFWRVPRTGAVIELPGDLRLRCERHGFRLEAAASADLPAPTACYLPKSSRKPAHDMRFGREEGSLPAVASPGEVSDREPDIETASTSDRAQEIP